MFTTRTLGLLFVVFLVMGCPIVDDLWKSRRARWSCHKALVVDVLVVTHFGTSAQLNELLRASPFLVSDVLLSNSANFPAWILSCVIENGMLQTAEQHGVGGLALTTKLPEIRLVLDALERWRAAPHPPDMIALTNELMGLGAQTPA